MITRAINWISIRADGKSLNSMRHQIIEQGKSKLFLRIILTPILAPILVMICSTVGSAQEEHQHHHADAKELGKVSFNISCSGSAQKQFNLAVAWLHSFEYDEAEKAFTQ